MDRQPLYEEDIPWLTPGTPEHEHSAYMDARLLELFSVEGMWESHRDGKVEILK